MQAIDRQRATAGDLQGADEHARRRERETRREQHRPDGRRGHGPSALGRVDEPAHVEQHAAGEIEPVAESVQTGKRHVARADQERQDEVHEGGRQRHQRQENHGGSVHREELAVGARADEVQVPPRELRPHQERLDAAQEEKAERSRAVKDADPLVVHGRQPRPNPAEPARTGEARSHLILIDLSSVGAISTPMRLRAMGPAWRLGMAVAMVGLVAGSAVAVARAARTETYQALDVYTEAMTIIHNQYVDELPWSKMVQDGIRGAIEGLDADSTVVETRKPAGAGDVGLLLTHRQGGLDVIATQDDSPARVAGLVSGDRIVSIDGVEVRTMSVGDAAERLQGAPGSRVALSVLRSGWAEPWDFTLTRAKPAAIEIHSRPLGAGVLYVRIPEITGRTAADLQRMVGAAVGPVTGLVLDLRNTVGGDVRAVPAVASLFLDPGCVVARVQSRISWQRAEMTTTTAPTRWTQPVTILVGRGATSAAEVLAGAMQDARRAVIVGTPTFGDASTQSITPLADGSRVSLTTSRYATPNGRPITGHGITPDVVVNDPAPDAASAAGARAAAADPALQLALDVVKAAAILQPGAPNPAATRETSTPSCSAGPA
jgi:carboxyl-terminal processing protease